MTGDNVTSAPRGPAAGMGVTIVPFSALTPRPGGTIGSLDPLELREVIVIVAVPHDDLLRRFVADLKRRGLPDSRLPRRGNRAVVHQRLDHRPDGRAEPAQGPEVRQVPAGHAGPLDPPPGFGAAIRRQQVVAGRRRPMTGIRDFDKCHEFFETFGP
jgi:hypothetical protein